MAWQHKLKDAQRDFNKDLFPRQDRGGKWTGHAAAFNGILWRLRTGSGSVIG